MNGNRRTRPSGGPKGRVLNLFARFCAIRSASRFISCLLLFSLISILLVLYLHQIVTNPEANKPSSFMSDILEKPKLNASSVPSSPLSPSIVAINQSSVPIGQQIPVLVFCAKRAKAIENHLKQLLRLRPSIDHFPVIVSQDGDDQGVADTIKRFVAENRHVYHIKHEQPEPATNQRRAAVNYFYISQHYKWALEQLFNGFGFSVVIITEDDLDISDDFFAYFNATRQLLYSDPTIWCISAWNDNGNPSLVDWEGGGPKLWRTDFFPGLGWMLRSELWAELRAKWPESYWDDFLRQQDIRKGRVCIRPEISRSLHNLAMAGKGSSNGLYKNFLSSMKLPYKQTNFSMANISLLEKSNFDPWFEQKLREAKEIPLKQMLESPSGKNDTENGTRCFIVRYKDPREFRQLSAKFGVMGDIRAGMARTAYYGVVPFFVGGVQFYAVQYSLDLTSQSIGSMASEKVYDQAWDKMSKYLDFAEMYCTPRKYTGKCDPYDEGMRQWFRSKGWSKRLELWGDMTVF